MTDIEFDDWMSENDALMWHMERDPLLRSTITTVWVLDQAPDQDRLDATLAQAVHAVPRLRQRVVADNQGIAPPKWEVDPRFEPDYHVRQGRIGGEGTLRDLLDAAAPIAMGAFDKDRPLWEFHQLDGLADGRVGIVMKLHHAISDGVGLVRMTGALMQLERDAEIGDPGDAPALPPPAASHTADAIRHRSEQGLRRGVSGAAALARGARDLARDPVGTAKSALETAESIARTVRPISEPMSPIMNARSLGVRFDELSLPFDQLRAAAKTANGTVNDVFVAAVLGGLARYHRHHDADCDELRMTMPINIRDANDRGHTAGNVFTPARFAVPLGIDDPTERITAVHALVQHERAEPAHPHTNEIATVLFGLTPPVFTRVAGSMLKAIDFVTSNVPGPPFPVYVSGGRVERSIPFGPLSGSAANLTLYSNDGLAEIGVNTDRAAVPDPDVFVECLQAGFDEVVGLA